MLQAANIDLFNPLVPKAQYSGGQNLLFPLQASLHIFIFYTLSSASALMGLSALRIMRLICNARKINLTKRVHLSPAWFKVLRDVHNAYLEN